MNDVTELENQLNRRVFMATRNKIYFAKALDMTVNDRQNVAANVLLDENVVRAEIETEYPHIKPSDINVTDVSTSGQYIFATIAGGSRGRHLVRFIAHGDGGSIGAKNLTVRVG